MHVRNVLTAINQLTGCQLRKSELSERLRLDFHHEEGVWILRYGCTTWNQTKRLKKIRENTQE